MKTVTLPGGSGGGSKKLIIDPSVEVRMFETERSDGADGLIAVDYRWLNDQNQEFWDDGYINGQLKNNRVLHCWQVATFVFAFAFAIALVMVLR